MVDRNTAGVSVFRPRFWNEKIRKVTSQDHVGGREAATALLSQSVYVWKPGGPLGAVCSGRVRSLGALVLIL